MNYRHSFHAGNFADVMKHAALLLILDYLQLKETPVFVLDTHAGRGVYDLHGQDAQKTAEWKDGIARLVETPPGGAIGKTLRPYLDLVSAFNPKGGLRTYPGSSALIKARLRPQDRALFCESEAGEAQRLRQLCAGDRRLTVHEGDGYAALLRALPPPERRGFALIDPPFEAPDEFSTLYENLAKAMRRFAHGVYAVWYPLARERQAASAFIDQIKALNLPKALRAELVVRSPLEPGLVGCGLLIINQPYLLEEQLGALLAWLAANLGQSRHASFALDSLGAHS